MRLKLKNISIYFHSIQKKRIVTASALILGISSNIQTLSACMPHSPNEVFIARLDLIESDRDATQFYFSFIYCAV